MKRISVKAAAFAAAAVISFGGLCAAPCSDTGFAITAEAASAKLSAPKNVRVSVPAADQIKLKWNKVSGAGAYRVYMLDPESKKYKSVKTVKGTSCLIDGLEPNDLYYFKVAALKRSGGKYITGTLSPRVKAAAVYSGEPLFEGVWIASDGKKVTGYYKLNADGSGSFRHADKEIGLAFEYERTTAGYVFHMGGVDDNSDARVSVSVSTGMRTLKWANGRTEYLRPARYQDPDAGYVVSCPLFSMMLPLEADFETETDGNSITVYDRESRENNCGGFAFNVSAYEKPSDYYGMMDAKVGELRTSGGNLYDIVITYPSDVQYDYEKYGGKMPSSYEKLFRGSDDIMQSIVSNDGGRFSYGAGMKGEELYGDVLKKHQKALSEGWDAEKLSSENMSIMYALTGSSSKAPVLDKIGYAYKDLNGDGIEELLIGEITDGKEGSVIYDIYSMKDRKPVHLASGWERNRYYTFEHGMIGCEYSGSASVSGVKVLEVRHNESELCIQCDFRYDSDKDKDNPWSIVYLDDEEGEKVSEKDFKQRKSNYGDFIHIDYTPFSSLR